MNSFPKVLLTDTLLLESIVLADAGGAATQVAILDDGWSPQVAAYVRDRDADKVYSDVVEELECITNVATRDAALQLIERINAMIRRAVHYAQTYLRYYVRIEVRTQFSTSTDSVAWIVGPPDDGEVITFSTDFQTAPAGKIRFRLRFKRQGLWFLRNNYRTGSFSLSRLSSAVYTQTVSLPVDPIVPTPASLRLNVGIDGTTTINSMYILTNVGRVTTTDSFLSIPPPNASIVSEPASGFARNNTVVRVVNNIVAPNYLIVETPTTLGPGSYAVFATCRPRAANSVHYLSLPAAVGGNDAYAYVSSAQHTNPQLVYFGVITLTTNRRLFWIEVRTGDTQGIDIDQFIFVHLFETSTLIQVQTPFTRYDSDFFLLQNHQYSIFRSLYLTHSLPPTPDGMEPIPSSDSLNVVIDRLHTTIAVLCISETAYSFVVNGFHVSAINAALDYHDNRTILF